MRRRVFSTLCLALFLASLFGAPPVAAQDASPVCPNERHVALIGWVCDDISGLLRLRDAPERGLVHGVDPPRNHNNDGPPYLGAPRDPFCVQPGDRYYIHLLYAVPTDRSPVASRHDLQRDLMRKANGILSYEAGTFNQSAGYRVLCDEAVMRVDEIQLSTTLRNTDFYSVVNDAAAQGYDLPYVKYAIWVERDLCAGGVGNIYYDDRPGYVNANNGHNAQWGINWACGGDFGAEVLMHENGHNLGAVQHGAPQSSGAGHCNDDADIMCYRDGGPNSGGYEAWVCGDRQHFDCNGDTYFHLAAPEGSWLHDHWNLGASYNRFIMITRDLPLEPIYTEDFDDGEAQGWTLGAFSDESLWHISDACTTPTSTPYYLGYHRTDACDFAHPLLVGGRATLPVDLTGMIGGALRFDHRWITGSSPDGLHVMEVVVYDGDDTYVLAQWDSTDPNQPDWNTTLVSLDAFSGTSFELYFRFQAGGRTDNAYPGWFIDNVTLLATDNIPPVAVAGPDQETTDSDSDGNGTFTLDGTLSHDRFDSGAIVAYEWTLGDTTLANGSTPTVTVPIGTHEVTLTVTDDKGGTHEDEVVLTVLPNQPPSAAAGPDVVVTDPDSSGNETITLLGSGSDPDGTIVRHEWRENGTLLATGQEVALALAVGLHDIEFIVIDDGGANATDQVRVSVAPNALPLADAGSAVTTTDHDSDGVAPVQLDGTRSTDTDGTVVDHVWTSVNGTLATGPTPTVMLGRGTHTLHLIVTDNGGGNDTDSVEVTVGPNLPPTADAGPELWVSDPDADGNATVALDGTRSSDADGALVQYDWSLGGSLIASGATAEVVLPHGDHTLTLRVLDDGAAMAETDLMVHVTDNLPPIADFTAACPDLTCTFDAAASQDDGTSLTYAWTFPDGTMATGLIVDHTFATQDDHEVCLEVTDEGGRVGDVCRSIRVVDALFFADFDDGTRGDIRTSDDWHVDDCGTPVSPPNHLGFHSSCTYYGGWSYVIGTATFTVDLQDVPDPVLHYYERWDVKPWATLTVQFSTNGQDWSTKHWVSGDRQTEWQPNTLSLSDHVGKTLHIRFLFDGNQARPATGHFGWQLDNVQVASASDLYLPNHPPVADAGPDLVVSDADDDGEEGVALDGSATTDTDGTIVNATWLRGGEAVAYGLTADVPLPVADHVLTLLVTDDEGATDSDTVSIQVLANQPPVAAAGPDVNAADPDGDGNATIPLDGGASTDADGTLVSYEWRSDGQTVATGAQAEVVLPVGVHTVTLEVVDNGGASGADTLVVSVAPNEPPIAVANASASPGDSDGDGEEPVAFDGSASADPDGSIIAYAWSENGTSLATGPTPTIFLSVGTHLIDLTVTDDGGVEATTSLEVTVEPNRPPLADAGTAATVRDGDGDGQETIPLDGSASSDPDGGDLAYAWHLDGTLLATGAKANVTLPVGLSTVTLQVTDAAGETGVDTVEVEVLPNAPPTASAGPDRSAHDADGDGNETVLLDGSLSSDLEGPLAHTWSLDGIPLATGPTPLVAIPVGSHTVVLVVEDTGGANATDSLDVVITPNQRPVAVAPPDVWQNDDDRTGDEPILFDGSASSDPGGAIVAYEWVLDGTLVATGATPTVNVPVGDHTFTLIVRDAANVTDDDTFRVEIAQNRLPTARFSVSCSDVLCSLDATASTDPDGDALQTTWSFGDGKSANGAAVTHAYPHAGRYTACVTVDDGNEGTDQTCRSLHLHDHMIEETFDGREAERWTLSGLWHVDDGCTAAASGRYYLGYHQTLLCNYQTISRTTGDARFTLDLRDATMAELSFQTRWQVESTSGNVARDSMRVQVRPTDSSLIHTLRDWDSRSGNRPGWTTETIDLGGYVGKEIEVRFHFDSYNELYNHHQGWFLDDVRVYGDGIRENDPPVARFTAACDGTTCTFDGTTTTDDRYVVDWAWDLGDGTTAAGSVVTHTFGADGTYEVRLLATDNRGDDAETAQQVRIGGGGGLPVADPPTVPPEDPQVPDQKDDLNGDTVPLSWMDIESAWFTSDPGYLYVAMKLQDLPVTARSNAFVAYHVAFTPTWTPDDPTFGGRIPDGELVERFEVWSHLSPVGQPGSSENEFSLWVITHDPVNHRDHERRLMDLDGDVSASTDIIWWPVARSDLGAPASATLTAPNAVASPSVRGTFSPVPAITGDATGTGRDHTF